MRNEEWEDYVAQPGRKDMRLALENLARFHSVLVEIKVIHPSARTVGETGDLRMGPLGKNRVGLDWRRRDSYKDIYSQGMNDPEAREKAKSVVLFVRRMCRTEG